MADIPRDPRQLARDILAGKVKIEDLARGRQMGGGGMAAPQQQQAKIPLPRQAPAPNAPPVQRGPVRSSQRPMPQQRPVPQQRMPQRPMPQQAQRPVPTAFPRQGAERPVLTVSAPAAAAAAVAPQSTVPVVEAVTRPTRGEIQLREMVGSKQALRQGIIMAEVLGKPVALRDVM